MYTFIAAVNHSICSIKLFHATNPHLKGYDGVLRWVIALCNAFE